MLDLLAVDVQPRELLQDFVVLKTESLVLRIEPCDLALKGSNRRQLFAAAGSQTIAVLLLLVSVDSLPIQLLS